MIDRRFASSVSAWLRRTDAPAPHPEDSVRRAMAQIHRTRQRRRWLWFLPGPKPTAGAEGQADGTRPAPGIHIHGGISNMFSATKVVGITAAAALLGAFLLAVPPIQTETTIVPAAPSFEPGEVTSYSGELHILGQDRAATIERFDWGNVKTGEQWTTRLTMSDPRVTGVSSGFQNVYEVGPEKTRLHAWTGRLFTKEGSWLESSHTYQDPQTTGLQVQTYRVGEGVYEGLYTVEQCSQPKLSGDWDCEGVILEGGLPEAPGEAPTEIPEIHLGP